MTDNPQKHLMHHLAEEAVDSVVPLIRTASINHYASPLGKPARRCICCESPLRVAQRADVNLFHREPGEPRDDGPSGKVRVSSK